MVSACSSGGEGKLVPRGEGLPELEIVFLPTDSSAALGFIAPDGSSYETRDVEVNTGPIGNLGQRNLAVWNTWSPDGQYLASAYSQLNLTAGTPMLIAIDGSFLMCPEDESSPYMKGQSWIVSGTDLLVVDTDVTNSQSSVLLVDMTTCTTKEVLYEGAAGEILLAANMSADGWLAIGTDFNVEGFEVRVIDGDGVGIAEIPGAMCPAWSPNGEQLTYAVYQDGLYVADKDGANVRRLIENDFISTPSWSPDGEWIVYSRPETGETTIFKVEVSTGNEVTLFRGGSHPNWRWRIPD